MRRGVTLIELLLSLSIVLVVTLSSTRALVMALDYDNHMRASRDLVTTRNQFEDRISFMLRHAWVSSDAADKNSYFIAGTPSLTPQTPGLPSSAGSGTPTGMSNTAGSGTNANGDPNQITLTVSGIRLSSSLLASKDDFETNNQNFGPQGGITEVSFSTTAVGSVGQNMTGVFMRTQAPADADPTQGGSEQLISSDVTQLGFEFFDGLNWQTSWDSRAQGTAGRAVAGRLPAAVKVTYRFASDSADRIFIVRLPASDATATNPVTVTG